MDVVSLVFSLVIVLLLVACLVCLFFYLPKRQEKLLKQQKESSNLEESKEEAKKATSELREKIEDISQKLKIGEEITKTLLENVDKNIKGEGINIKTEIANQQKIFQEKNKELNERLNKENKEWSEKINKDLELRLNNSQQLIKTHLENLNKGISKPLEKLNSVLLQSDERGRWGNTQLEQLLSLYLPKSDKIYQMEFKLKKKRASNREEGLRVDAIIFGPGGENNLAIDSKFPLKNYLPSTDSNLTEKERKEFEEKFKNDVKEHIEKVAEYVSEEDGTKYAIMFVPSEVIFSKLFEQRYYDAIVSVALKKKVSICSPTILLVTVDQLLSWVKIWEQYKDLDKITSEIGKFLNNLRLFKERWEVIYKMIKSSNKAIENLDTSTRKLIEGGEKIKDRENSLSKELPEDLKEE
jgi:DNA recombination protein RmuC